ncbi:MAG: metal ABC transporter permease [Chloroflexota bacterium]|nr:metal ABC transporter permease [Chloroflexota bacterium]
MIVFERIIVDLLLRVVPMEALNAALSDPQTVAVILGALIAISGALLGSFLLLRGMAMTSDAISHTVLLGIVVAFLVMTGVFGLAADLGSPLLIIGAALAGVATVVLTELIYRSGLVKQDAALGLAFPLLFAVAIILVARFVDDVHIDTDAVMVGEIGIAWADTNSHCFSQCDPVVITPDDPRAEIARVCTNCRDLSITPRDPTAQFAETCANCGEFTPAAAWAAGLTNVQPVLVFFPRSLTIMGILTALTVAFVTLFYKELKLSTFDSALARSLGFRPGMLHYALMILVSLVAVGAFSAVGSVLVVAFFIIPAAAAYLLTDRLAPMLAIAAGIGAAGAYFGYGLARGSVFGLFEIGAAFAGVNRLFGTTLPETWDSSISASMVLAIFALFMAAWVLSPRYGLIAGGVRRARQRVRFGEIVLMGHVRNHEGTAEAADELASATLHTHLRWTAARAARMLGRLRGRGWVETHDGLVSLTARGREQVEDFRRDLLPTVIVGVE